MIDVRTEHVAAQRVEPGSRSIKRLLTHTARHAGEAAQQVVSAAVAAMVVAAIIAKTRSRERDGKDTESVTTSIAQSITTSSIDATKKLVVSSVTTARDGWALSAHGAAIETYARLATEPIPSYAKPNTVAEVKAWDMRVERQIARGTTNSEWFEWAIRHREQVLLSIPYQPKDLSHWASEPLREAIAELIADYPPENQLILAAVIQEIRKNSVSKNPKRVQVYIHGPAGTGKTRLVKRLKTILAAPFIKTSIPEKNLDSLLGQTYPIQYADPKTPDDKTVGDLQVKLIRSGYTNPIVFVDEIKMTARNVNDLKLMLDGGKTSIKVGGYEAEVPWDRVTFIAGSNDPLDDPHLSTRMMIIEIKRVTAEKKKEIVSGEIRMRCADYDNDFKDRQDLRKRLLSTCIGQVNELERLDSLQFPGARVLQHAGGSLVHFVAGGLLNQNPYSKDQIARFLTRLYSGMSHGTPAGSDSK